jgi:threonine/homoserine/homoserine lactone efflux protein
VRYVARCVALCPHPSGHKPAVTMGEAIGEMLPFAVGVAISPMPIVAVVLMLVTAKGRVNGPVFLSGWLGGIAAVGAILLLVASGGDASGNGKPAAWLDWVKLVLGILLLLVALRQWRARPSEDDEPAAPKWMAALDDFTPIKAAGAGTLLSAVNPKNLLLIVAGAAPIAQTGISAGEQAVALAVFVVIASVGVGTPVFLYFALGDRSRATLERLKTWMARNNTVIMAVLLLVIGVKLIGDALTGFSG